MSKFCSRCNICLSVESFHKDKIRFGGRKSACKTCTKEYSKKYNNLHKDERREYDKQYRENHKDGRQEYNKPYNISHIISIINIIDIMMIPRLN